MPVKAIRTVSSSRNGLAAYILPLTRLSFTYSDWAGSSKGMNAFLKHTLPPFAATHPSIEIVISPLQGGPKSHPSILAHYVNGSTKSISARNLEPGEILGKVRILRDGDGSKNRRVRGAVVRVGEGTEEGVRGVWSGLHEEETRKI